MSSNKLPTNYDEYKKIYIEISSIWERELKDQNVRLPKEGSAKSFWLVALYSNIGKPLGNTEIYEWMMKFPLFFNRKPKLKSDQQIRHLAGTYGWNVLGGGELQVKGKKIKIKAGDFMMLNIDLPRKHFNASRRQSKLPAKDFQELKRNNGNICATCWHKEGTIHPKLNKKIKLQQGHMNPNKNLSIENAIPQCQYCNQTYKDDFIFGKDGRIAGINKVKFFFSMDPDIFEKEIENTKIPVKMLEILRKYIK